MINHSTRLSLAISLFLISFSGFIATPASCQHPNRPLGVDPNRQIQSAAAIDNVDLFSGNLTMSIPIGPFSLTYNSNVWRYQIEVEDDDTYVHARVDRRATGGMGWHLGWGEVYSPTHPYNPNDQGEWLYVDENGGNHVFHDRKLHEGDADDPDPNRANWMYSRDGSYMRFHRRCVNGCEIYMVTIEFPDGTTRLFDSGTGGWNTTYHLHKVWGPHASENDPDLTIEYDRVDPMNYSAIVDRQFRTVTDRAGRQHHITLDDSYPEFDRLVTAIDIEGFGGQRAVYTFEYGVASVHRSCKDDWDGTAHFMYAPFLTKINFPDGSSYSMADGGTPRYDLTECHSGVDDLPGVISGITLPTGGGIEWAFQEYSFPPGDSNSVFNTSAGVRTRQLVDHQGAADGNPWTYRTSAFGHNGDIHPEIHTEVVSPDGSCSKHYFDAIYYVYPSPPQGPEGWERALPFVYTADDGDGKFLSSEVYPTNTGGDRCSGQPLRSKYVRYRVDQFPGGNDLAEWTRLNAAVEASRTVFHDDDDRYIDNVLSDFTGVGSFRKAVSTGTLWDSSTQQERRETFTHADAGRGIYPSSYTPVLISDRWLFGLFDYQQSHEPDAVGGAYSRTEVDFAEDGFMSCVRTLSSSTATGGHVQRSSNDLVTVLRRYVDPQTQAPDPYGSVGTVELFGGDLQAIATLTRLSTLNTTPLVARRGSVRPKGRSTMSS